MFGMRDTTGDGAQVLAKVCSLLLYTNLISSRFCNSFQTHSFFTMSFGLFLGEEGHCVRSLLLGSYCCFCVLLLGRPRYPRAPRLFFPFSCYAREATRPPKAWARVQERRCFLRRAARDGGALRPACLVRIGSCVVVSALGFCLLMVLHARGSFLKPWSKKKTRDFGSFGSRHWSKKCAGGENKNKQKVCEGRGKVNIGSLEAEDFDDFCCA